MILGKCAIMKGIKCGGKTMVYLFFALYGEAKPFIEKWKLKKQNQYTKYQVFERESFCCVVTGVGSMKMAIHATHFLTSRNIQEEDIFCNIGIAGTKASHFDKGELYFIHKIHSKESGRDFYPELLYRQKYQEASLETFSKVVEKEEEIQEDLVDMEGAAFFETLHFFAKKKQIFLWKCVSDFLEGEKVNPEELLKKHCEGLATFLEQFHRVENREKELFQKKRRDLEERLWKHLFCSETMRIQGKDLLHYAELSEKNVEKMIQKYLRKEVKTKTEGKKYFEDLRNEILEF